MNRSWIVAAGIALYVPSALADHLADVTSPKWQGRMVSHTLAVQADTQWVGTNDWADYGSSDGSVSPVPEIDDSHLVVAPAPGGSTEACVKPSNNPCPGGPLGYET